MFTLTIKTGNAAFCDDNGEPNAYARDREIARILRHLAKALEDDGGIDQSGTYLKAIWDRNGGHVGQFEIE